MIDPYEHHDRAMLRGMVIFALSIAVMSIVLIHKVATTPFVGSPAPAITTR